ncbi:hypothetical protein NDU88_006686 [Pleurodeles waltl]|uniref:Uncharacterized protein n=1 Tax=Pleurodeles waltl TaxID=8319 RepID=A0AAV7QMN2_PLEWA|nr:hypothetical protein NDU88_006686 [Pleurodeles waltl]
MKIRTRRTFPGEQMLIQNNNRDVCSAYANIAPVPLVTIIETEAVSYIIYRIACCVTHSATKICDSKIAIRKILAQFAIR